MSSQIAVDNRLTGRLEDAAGQDASVMSMFPSTPPRESPHHRGRRWGVILAGGDGTRLQKLTQLICGDDRPKQFCPLLGGDTLLEQTRNRAERSIPADQILFSLSRRHRDSYLKESGLRTSRRIVQPENKGTAPAILFGAFSIERMDRDALVAVLPSDHYYSEESIFTSTLESAFEIAAEHSESIVLIGAQPDRPEVEYGWIELGSSVESRSADVVRVRAFREKPSLETAQMLLSGNSVWNTFVMVGHVRAWATIARAIPDILEAVRRMPFWSGYERHLEPAAYDQMRFSDFSKQVLSVEVARLLVLRARNLGWCDLGDPDRVLAVLNERGLKLSSAG